MAKIVMVGGGLCGLAAALLLRRDGHEVTVLERDDTPVPASPEEAWEHWERTGVGQFRLPHFLQVRGATVLAAELPDVHAALVAAGAVQFDTLTAGPATLPPFERRPGDERFVTVTAHRPTLEQVVAGVAEREPGLRVERGVHVTGLEARQQDGVGRVVGVRTADGGLRSADLVVDAMGRRSPLPAWLRDSGCAPLHEEGEDSGFTYYSRFFRSPEGALPETVDRLQTPFGSFSLLTLPGDHRMWSVSVVVASHDVPLRELRRPDVWSRVVAALPLHAHWLDGEPATGVLAMGGLVDRYRRLVVDGAPAVTGLTVLADSWGCTNPSLGRGVTFGLMHAACLRDALRTPDDDPRAVALAFDAATETTVTPWYRATVSTDRRRRAEMTAIREGRELPQPKGPAVVGASFAHAAGHDAELHRAFMEVGGCSALPAEVLTRPGMAERVLAVAAAHPVTEAPGPDRAQLLALVGAADEIPTPRQAAPAAAAGDPPRRPGRR